MSNDSGSRAGRSLFAWIGGAAVVAIVLASVLVRLGGPADPAADVSQQRAAVVRFHELVRSERWADVYRSTTEPPTRDVRSFVELMRTQVRERGRVVSVSTEGMRLLRSRAAPLLEVRESVVISRNGTSRRQNVVSYFARRGERWLFAFSAPRDA